MKQERKRKAMLPVAVRNRRNRYRGKGEEYACAKKTNGVVVGRSKAVMVRGKSYRTDCQKPPDVISPPYAFEVKNKPISKAVEKAMRQAWANCPEGLSPRVWWRDTKTGDRYLIEMVRDFLDDHIGKGETL